MRHRARDSCSLRHPCPGRCHVGFHACRARSGGQQPVLPASLPHGPAAEPHACDDAATARRQQVRLPLLKPASPTPLKYHSYSDATNHRPRPASGVKVGASIAHHTAPRLSVPRSCCHTAGLRAISAVSPTHRGAGQEPGCQGRSSGRALHLVTLAPGLLGSAWDSWWRWRPAQPPTTAPSERLSPISVEDPPPGGQTALAVRQRGRRAGRCRRLRRQQAERGRRGPLAGRP